MVAKHWSIHWGGSGVLNWSNRG